MYCKEKEKELYEHYQTQLDIVQYLVDIYPQAMFITNKQGNTPLQLALSSSTTKRFVFPTRHGQQTQQHFIHGSNNNNKRKNRNNNKNNTTTIKARRTDRLLYNPIIEFLLNHPLQVSSSTKLIDDRPPLPSPALPTTKTTAMNELIPETTSHALDLDVSGRIYDEEEDDIIVMNGFVAVHVAPWKKQSNHMNSIVSDCTNKIGRMETTSTVRRRASCSHRRGSVCTNSSTGGDSSSNNVMRTSRTSTHSTNENTFTTPPTTVCPIEKVCQVLDELDVEVVDFGPSHSSVSSLATMDRQQQENDYVDDYDIDHIDEDETDFLCVRQRLQYTYNDNSCPNPNYYYYYHDPVAVGNKKQQYQPPSTTRTLQKHCYKHEG